MVKTLHSKGTCRHDKNIVKSNWHSTEEIATFHDNIGMGWLKVCIVKELVDITKIVSKKIGVVLRYLPRSMTI